MWRRSEENEGGFEPNPSEIRGSILQSLPSVGHTRTDVEHVWRFGWILLTASGLVESFADCGSGPGPEYRDSS